MVSSAEEAYARAWVRSNFGLPGGGDYRWSKQWLEDVMAVGVHGWVGDRVEEYEIRNHGNWGGCSSEPPQRCVNKVRESDKNKPHVRINCRIVRTLTVKAIFE